MTPIPDKPLDLDELEKMLGEATPGPWWNDSGNGQIESRDKTYWRAVVCDRAESFTYTRYTGDNPDPRYEMCPSVVRINPEADMELIEALRNAAPALLDLVRKADAWLAAHDLFHAGNEATYRDEYRKARQKAGGKGDG